MKSKIVSVVMTLVLALGMSFALVACDGAGGGGGVGGNPNIVNITTSKQNSNGVSYVNYSIIVKDSANWDTLSTADKQKIVTDGFVQVRAKAADSGINAYNIVGVNELPGEDSQYRTLFMYDREHEEVIYYVGGQIAGNFPAPAAK